MNEYAKKISRLFKNAKVLSAIAVIGIAGMILIMLGEPSGGGEKETKTGTSQTELSAFAEEYARTREKELCELLSGISGAGRVSVMLRVSCSEEYVFACAESGSSDYSADGTGTRNYSRTIFAAENDGDKEAVVSKIICPEISGAAVVCEGAGDARVREAVCMAVSAALDIPVGSIYVTR